MTYYKLEKNVPLSLTPQIEARWKKMCVDMQIGDSRVVKTDVEAERLCAALKRMSRCGTMRRIGGGPTYRVWRIG